MIAFMRPILALAMLAAAGAVHAEEISKEDIVNALDPSTATKPGGLTRSWSRGVTVQKSTQPDGPPSIDLYINFEFDSDRLETDSLIVLNRLATALADPRLSSFHFLVGGHTDAKGTEEYNQKLSERRAGAVISYLVNNQGIAQDRLIGKGFGESQLADVANPEGAANRRVQIVNIDTAATN